MANLDQQNMDAINSGGIRTGFDTRIIFESTVREKDDLEAKFVASFNGQGNGDDVIGVPLSLSKVSYRANVADWFSMVAIPVGVQFKDFAVLEKSSFQRGLSEYSSSGPPLLDQYNGAAIGLTVKKSNVISSMAQCVADIEVSPTSIGHGQCFSSFAHVMCELPWQTKFSLFGLQQVPKLSSLVNPGALTIPIGFPKRDNPSETMTGESDSAFDAKREGIVSMASTKCFAAMLETQFDESTKFHGWLQMENSDPRRPQWAVTMSDTSEDDVGWGLNIGGRASEHFLVEASLKFIVGKNFSLQPGIVYINEGNNHTPALMFRSTWSL